MYVTLECCSTSGDTGTVLCTSMLHTTLTTHQLLYLPHDILGDVARVIFTLELTILKTALVIAILKNIYMNKKIVNSKLPKVTKVIASQGQTGLPPYSKI